MKQTRISVCKALRNAMGACLLTGLLAFNAKAANDYFTTTPGTYSWDDPNWSTVAGGPYTSSYVQGSFPRFNGTGTFNITCNASESMVGMFGASGETLNITNAGTGGFSIPANSAQVTQNGFTWVQQGFFTGGGTINLSLPISGAGGVGENSGGGNLNLYGSNSFTGGFLANSSSTFIGFNNNNSFGAASSQLGFETTFGIMNNTGPATVNIPNPVQYIGNNLGLNFIGNACTMSGSFYFGGSTFNANIRNNGASGVVLTLAGPLTGTSGTLNFSGANGAVILLTAANTYTGTTSIGVSGDANITLEIAATGSIASTTITNFGVLKLDGAACLKTNATLQLSSSAAAGSVNLNFSGTQSLGALYIGGVLQTGGTWGSPTSGAQNTSSIFTGSGMLSTPQAPAIVTPPQSVACFPGGTAIFQVAASGAQPLNYQWYSNNVALSGQNNSTYSISPVDSSDAANYSVKISNVAGSVTSAQVSLTVLPTNSYTSQIINNAGLGLISYWRLDETNGTVAHDDYSTNNGTYVNVTLGQPGFSVADSDTCIGLPQNTNSKGYVIVSNSSPFNAMGVAVDEAFTVEGWAYFTNLTGVQRMFSTLSLNYPYGWAFGVNGNNDLRFTVGGVQDADMPLQTNMLTTGVWYYLACVCDGANLYFYVNGNQIYATNNSGTYGSVQLSGVGGGVSAPLQFGANPATWLASAPEQVQGRLDELAIYQSAFNSQQIMADYLARPMPAIPVVGAPIVSAPTNYVSLTTTLDAVASGQGTLAYQWYLSPSTELNGETNATLTLTNLQLNEAGDYYVSVSNQGGQSNSPSAAITVLPIPTNYTQLNLTNALVLHLPFDGSYGDASGRGNSGTNVGATSFVPGIIGADALHYDSDTSVPTYNYVTLGERPDLKFSSNIDFSVSFWIRETNGSSMTNLPFFGDLIGSTSAGAGTPGYAFAPYQTATTTGGWQWTVDSTGFTASSPSGVTSFSDANLLNDGNWHNLVFVAQRSADLTTYLDGIQLDTQPINYVGDFDNANVANIGQDPTGTYAATGAADMDDLGVWTRTLSQLEVSGIYLAGVSNVVGVSFASSAVVTPPTYVTLSVQASGSNIQLTWPGGGNLQGSAVVSGPYTNIVGATSPYTAPNTGSQMFYRVHP